VLSPRLTLPQRQRLLRLARPDILFMQGSRHSLNRPGLYPGHRIVYDMDDADFCLPHLAAPVRDAMPRVDAVIAGSRHLAEWCRQAGAGEAHVVWTGMPALARPAVPHVVRSRPVVAWSQTRPMDYHREAEMVREVMAGLVRNCPGARLRIYDRLPGDDPAFADWFREAGIPVEWRPRLALRDYLTSFDDVSLGLAPLSAETPFSRGKSFGKVLAYLDRRVPVIGSDLCEHGAFFRAETGVISNDLDRWISEAGFLLADPARRQNMSDRAYRDFRAQLSIEAAGGRVDRILRQYLP
jgi:hypothetical protein